MEFVGEGVLQQQGSLTDTIIDNHGTLIFNDGSDVAIKHQGGWGTIHNRADGTLIKRGTGDTSFGNQQYIGDFNNDGLVLIEEGQLLIHRDQNSDGTFQISPEATLFFGLGAP